ncbi:NAD(P)H-quinone oxidoreductase subunit M, chloroplastic-like isoform X3 [Ananas comosus]|uniref:NAD(P)H-quinone oxidoreductase subunit M, chloroplastic n=1 Tax=Ananas comosus TaxID=4615 RepID=A0A6P5ENH5_ANACO|nr:NAD(P)H-quinone oxidoreductase subunit M, chloroplastic-like isoform X2 [Ananas comosus]XP_020085211.1 NAD(P)H-quinone oxidoreductase subunit M, chloroplastic-like isoform X3 [Ananas comosus]
MASTASSFLSPAGLSVQGWAMKRKAGRSSRSLSVAAQQQQQQQQQQQELLQEQEQQKPSDQTSLPQQQQQKPAAAAAGVQQQRLAKSKNMSREYGGQWLSSVTRHVRIYAAYIDPVTHAFDQTQMDKLTLLLDPGNEFVWSPEACQKVYSCFQELVDHYEGAPLSEYTLRLIGSDLEHYIRKLLYDGEIKYNMNARVLNFSMGKPRVKFNSSQIPNVQ